MQGQTLVAPQRTEQAKITIIGDRQHGKTYTLLGIAIQEAADGMDVLYVGPRDVETSNAFHDAAEMAKRRYGYRVKTVHVSNGSQRIIFDNGKQVRFTCIRAKGGRTFNADVMILDNVEIENDMFPHANRIYRGVLA